MSEQSPVEQVEHSIRNAGTVGGSQAEVLAQESMRFTGLRDQMAPLVEGAEDPAAQEIPALYDMAAQKTQEAAALLKAAEEKIGDYLGRLTGKATNITLDTSDAPQTIASEEITLQYTELEEKGERRRKATQARLNKKAYFMRQFIASRSTPTDPNNAELITDSARIVENLQTQKDKDGTFASLLHDFLDTSKPFDIFEVQDYVRAVVDALLLDVPSLDLLDLVIAYDGFDQLIREHIPPHGSKEEKTRTGRLEDAVLQELVARVRTNNVLSAWSVSLGDLYDRAFGPSGTAAQSKRRAEIEKDLVVIADELQARMRTLEEILKLNLFNLSKATKNDYNKLATESERLALNAAAAEALEGIQLLKTNGIAPMIIPAKAIRMSADIAVHPPIPNSGGHLEKGVLADFFILPPNDNRQAQSLIRKEEVPEEGRKKIVVGDHEKSVWVRLFDNGQITTGNLIRDMPNDHLEKLFAEYNSSASYERIRALLISIVYDSIVPETVVREQTGGSVAARLSRRPPTPNLDPFTDLALQRQRVLRDAKVSSENPKPSEWEWPKRVVGGYMRRLPEGYRARGTAETEAREYFKRQGMVFEGLPEGTNFIPEFTRGTGPARADYRRAHFRPDSKTRKLLKKRNE